MKKNKATSIIETLSREVLIEILSRLPIPSLLNIKLVCKSWRNLAYDPLLVDLHFNRKMENNPCLILHSDHPIKNQLIALFLYPNNNNPQAGILKKIDIPNMPEFDIIGSSNGWLCLFDCMDKNKFYMYNPFTSSCMELPLSPHRSKNWTVFGFGFDLIKKEYKVLQISSVLQQANPRRPCGSYGFHARADVLILTVGNPNWRSLGVIPYYPIEEPSQVFINGRLHWVNWPLRYKPGREIISFDLEDEEFLEVPLPDSASMEWGGYMLIIIRECLCAAIYRNYGSFVVWCMKDYGVKESWVKEFSIGVYIPKGLEQDIDYSYKVSKFYRRKFTRILCGLKNGEILIEYRRRALVSYDPILGVFKDITVPEMPNWFEAFVHVGNLYTIDNLFGL